MRRASGPSLVMARFCTLSVRRGSTRWRPRIRRGEIGGLAPGVLRIRRGSSHKTPRLSRIRELGAAHQETRLPRIPRRSAPAPRCVCGDAGRSAVRITCCCSTPGAAATRSARAWLLWWPSSRAPTRAARFCDSSVAQQSSRSRSTVAFRGSCLLASRTASTSRLQLDSAVASEPVSLAAGFVAERHSPNAVTPALSELVQRGGRR